MSIKVRRVSNNITLFLKMFLPTFWFVFFTTFLIAIFFIDPDKIPLLGSSQFKMVYIGMYLIFAVFLYFTIMQLLRVDMGPDKFYVSNYMKTYAYAYSDIKAIKETNYGIVRLITIHLKNKGALRE